MNWLSVPDRLTELEVGAVGYEHPNILTENQQVEVPSGAESGAVKGMVGEETLDLIRIMAEMPKPLRDAVIQIVRSTKGE